MVFTNLFHKILSLRSGPLLYSWSGWKDSGFWEQVLDHSFPLQTDTWTVCLSFMFDSLINYQIDTSINLGHKMSPSNIFFFTTIKIEEQIDWKDTNKCDYLWLTCRKLHFHICNSFLYNKPLNMYSACNIL